MTHAHLLEEASVGAFLGVMVLLLLLIVVATFGLPWVPGSAEASTRTPVSVELPSRF